MQEGRQQFWPFLGIVISENKSYLINHMKWKWTIHLWEKFDLAILEMMMASCVATCRTGSCMWPISFCRKTDFSPSGIELFKNETEIVTVKIMLQENELLGCIFTPISVNPIFEVHRSQPTHFYINWSVGDNFLKKNSYSYMIISRETLKLNLQSMLGGKQEYSQQFSNKFLPPWSRLYFH